MFIVTGKQFREGGRRWVSALLLTSILASASATAAAQTAPQVLPPTREEVTRPEAPPPEVRAPRLEVEGEIERAPCALDNPEFQNIRITVRGAEFEGLQGLSATELQSAYSSYVGTEQPISVVCEIRDRAATILRNAGYIAAVEVPEQRIADGVVRFRVLMARLTEVRVRGNATGAERIIAGYLNQLTKQPVFNRYEAERYLLLASDLPGYLVRLTLRPAGSTPGEVIGDVTVQRTPAYADFNVQNGGSRELGRWGGLVRGQLFGLTGLGDRTTIAAFSTADLKEQQTLQLGHDFKLGSEGLGLGGLFTYAWAHPSIEGDSDVRARTLLATLQADYPFLRSLSRNLRGTAGMDIVNQDVEIDSIDLARDRIRVAFARLGLDAIDEHPLRERPIAGRAVVAVQRLARISQGARHPRGDKGLRPDRRRLPGPRPGPAQPARGSVDRGGRSRLALRRIPPGSKADPLARRARAICVEAAAELRGILGRQLYGRPRL